MASLDDQIAEAAQTYAGTPESYRRGWRKANGIIAAYVAFGVLAVLLMPESILTQLPQLKSVVNAISEVVLSIPKLSAASPTPERTATWLSLMWLALLVVIPWSVSQIRNEDYHTVLRGRMLKAFLFGVPGMLLAILFFMLLPAISIETLTDPIGRTRVIFQTIHMGSLGLGLAGGAMLALGVCLPAVAVCAMIRLAIYNLFQRSN